MSCYYPKITFRDGFFAYIGLKSEITLCTSTRRALSIAETLANYLSISFPLRTSKNVQILKLKFSVCTNYKLYPASWFLRCTGYLLLYMRSLYVVSCQKGLKNSTISFTTKNNLTKRSSKLYRKSCFFSTANHPRIKVYSARLNVWFVLVSEN